MLFGSTMLEIAISLFFVYLLMSLICSASNEWIAGIFNLRGKTLRSGIANLLNDPDGQALAAELYEHPLIAGLTDRRVKGPVLQAPRWLSWLPFFGQKNEKLPSYISADTFIHAMLDITRPEDAAPKARTLIDLYQEVQGKAVKGRVGVAAEESVTDPDEESDLEEDNPLEKILLAIVEKTGLDSSQIDEARETLERLAEARKSLSKFVTDTAENFEDGIEKKALEEIAALEGILRQGEEEVSAVLAQLQEGVESYFDQAMERVGGWYKRRAQLIIVLLAVLFSGFLNVDSVAITTSLASNNALRASIVAAAEQTIQNPDDSLQTSLAEALDAKDELAELGLPIGWALADDPAEADSLFAYWLSKVLGIIITAVAVSLGAPFWFDLLNKLVNLRMAGQKS